jgi:hypothetical protein
MEPRQKIERIEPMADRALVATSRDDAGALDKIETRSPNENVERMPRLGGPDGSGLSRSKEKH